MTPQATGTTDGELVGLLQELSEEFDKRCQDRHTMGAQKYGEGTWLNVDTLESCIEELIDMANYIRYTYLKLRLMQEGLGTDKTTNTPIAGKEMLGKDAFISAIGRTQ